MAVTLSLRSPVEIPLEVDGVLPDLLRSVGEDDFLRLPVTQGNQAAQLGDFFEATRSGADDLTLVFEGDLKAVKGIGRGLSSGNIVVNGSAGMHLGAGMSGGTITVHGDVTDWAGAEMSGGRIHVFGSVGDLAGAGYRGSVRGMTGGELLVEGNAGHEIGRVMRRGMIAIGGNVGDYCGSRMIAGSIFVFGDAGRRTGAGMKRGTIGLFGPSSPELLPTFSRAGESPPGFLELYWRHLTALGFRGLKRPLLSRIRRWCGDALTLGLGEIVTPAY